MQKTLCTVLLWPVDIAAIKAVVKVTGLTQGDVIRTLYRVGVEAIKDLPVSEIKKLAFDLEADYAAKQYVLTQEGTSPYAMDIESKN